MRINVHIYIYIYILPVDHAVTHSCHLSCDVLYMGVQALALFITVHIVTLVDRH